ncbi:shootin-1-like isoform X2 [Mizuhopecten yessoensis]|uniref:shootin-1-like isoform X2 n=1 Tax=Mizuhopecten yessoensis TaxID=6573 RepID=UPI000B45EE1B|nr:shootin-1-like isoform X2 [Mizuhopecten yessoensis]
MADASCSQCFQYKHLKELSAKVVIQYDELYKKLKATEEQCKTVSSRLKEREQQMGQMKKLIEPAIQEYEKMKIKFEIEMKCRMKAENFATHINVQNKELKRQSNMIMAKMDVRDLPLDDSDMKSDVDSYKKHTAELNETIEELEENVARLTSDLQELRQTSAIEEEKHQRLNERHDNGMKRLKENQNMLSKYQEAMLELSKVSEEACKEYAVLQIKYDMEHEKASKMQDDNKMMKKQSAMLMTNAMGNQKLMDAALQIESLTKEFQEEKEQYLSQIKELQEAVNDGQNDEEKEKLSEENKDLMKKLEDYEKQYKELEAEYKVIEKELDLAKHPPPPPPPPPPPTPSMDKGKGFLSKITRKKSMKRREVLKSAAGAGDQNYGKALEEMMKRIQSGKALTKVLKPVGGRRVIEEEEEEDDDDEPHSDKDEPPSDKLESHSIIDPPKIAPSLDSEEKPAEAMVQLHSILNRFKRTQSESDLTDPAFTDSDSDLAKTFRKVKRSASDDTDPPDLMDSVNKEPQPEPVVVNKVALRHVKQMSTVQEERTSVLEKDDPNEEDTVF